MVEGITRALVSLNTFARAEITNYSSVDRKTEVYKGKYEIYEDKYLRLELTISGTFGKDLTILVYVGKNDPKAIDLVLGLYHNIDEEHMYTGTVILQRIQSSDNEKPEPKFVNKDNLDDRKLIDEKIWTYLSNKSQNRIRVKPGIITMDKFSVWLQRQNKKRIQRGQQGKAGPASHT